MGTNGKKRMMVLMFMYSWENREMGLQPILYSRFTGQDREELGTNTDQGPGDSWQWCLATCCMAFFPFPIQRNTYSFQQTPDQAKTKQNKSVLSLRYRSYWQTEAEELLRTEVPLHGFCIAPLNMNLTCMYSVGDLYSWYIYEYCFIFYCGCKYNPWWPVAAVEIHWKRTLSAK